MVELAHGFTFAFVRSASVLASAPGGASPCATSGASPGATSGVKLFGGEFESANTPADGGLTVTEVSDGGSVPVLHAANLSTFDYFLIAGQVVRGGKQNRGINIDVLIESGKTAQIPVTCVEQGRWSGTASDRFRHGGIEPISVRSRKMHQTHDALRACAAPVADQSAVWSEIAYLERSVGAQSRTSDLLESIARSVGGRAGGRSRGAASDAQRDLLAQKEAVERDIAELTATAESLARRIAAGIADPDAPVREWQDQLRGQSRMLADLRARLREVEQEIGRARHQNDSGEDGGGENDEIIDARVAEADAAARESNGLLVFFGGEFLAGDLFADPAWFRRIYGDLRDSAMLSWTVAAQRRRILRAPRATSDRRHPIDRLARSIVRDAIAGEWVERKAAAHGRAFTLEHPFLEGSVLATGKGAPLHAVIGAAQLPEILRTDRASARGPRRMPPIE